MTRRERGGRRGPWEEGSTVVWLTLESSCILRERPERETEGEKEENVRESPGLQRIRRDGSDDGCGCATALA